MLRFSAEIAVNLGNGTRCPWLFCITKEVAFSRSILLGSIYLGSHWKAGRGGSIFLADLR